MPTYSFGPDKMADLYNQAVEEWFKAQRRFTQKFGRQWDPSTEPIEIRWSRKQRKAWNQFGKIMDSVIAKDGPFHENDIMDDFLVKNVGGAVMRTKKFGRGLSLAVFGGMLFELLRGR